MNLRTLLAACLITALVPAVPFRGALSPGKPGLLYAQDVATSAETTVSANAVSATPASEKRGRAGTGSLAPRRGSELERLRELQTHLTRTIDRAMQSVVFIQGGSGFVISEDGYVLTNNHVVAQPRGRRSREEVREVVVQFRRGRPLQGDVVGRDPGGDVALVKLRRPPGVPPLPLGDSDELRVGQPVVAIGDPFLVGSQEFFLRDAPPDYEPAASMGIISALHRYSEGYTDSIQVDAAVNPGNSGGPLLTLEGKVVGINGKIENPFGVGINAGVGYAIPINQVKRFLEQLKEADGGIVRHGTIPGLDVEARAKGKPGLRVRRVKSGSAAERYGFKPDDLILSVAGQDVRTENRYRGVLGTYPEGAEVLVRLERGDRSLEIEVALFESDDPWIGVELDNDQPADEKGVRILQAFAGGPAARAGMRPADTIRRLGDGEVSSRDDLRRLLEGLKPGDAVTIGVLRDGRMVDVEVRLASRRPE